MAVVLVTGSTDGIGRQTALELARRGAEVIVHGRSRERAMRTAEEIAAETGNRHLWPVVGDFSQLNQVRTMVAEMASRVERLDVLVNNAGTYQRNRVVNPAGLEMTFLVNHLSPFLLTLLLTDLLRMSAPARIVTVASMVHQSASLEFDNLQGEKAYEPHKAYAVSKLANVLFTYELADRLAGTGITANCLHPGVITTKLLREGFGGMGSSVQEGAATSVFLAADPSVEGVSGKYFVAKKEAVSSWLSHDKALRARLWTVSEELVNQRFS